MSSPQLPLTPRYPPDQRFDTYLDGRPETVALLRALAHGARADRVFVSGPAGSGKTHLLLATCAAAADHGVRAAYLPLAEFATRLTDALAAQEGAALVCIDGIEAIAGVREAEIALFDCHNRVQAAGGALVYAAAATPAQLPLVLPDLRSRLAQCVQLPLLALDEEGRRRVLRQRAAARGLSIDDAVLDYLFKRIGRDLGTLTVLLDRLDRESLAAQRRLSVPFLRQTLGL